MAKLSVHGQELLRVELMTSRLSFRSDGHVLRNYGSGWKLWKRLKPKTNPEEHVKKRGKLIAKKDASMPCYVAFRSEMHSIIKLEDRSLVLRAIQLMPDDPDGCWSELCDNWYGIGLSPDEIVNLCRLYNASQIETEQLKGIEK